VSGDIVILSGSEEPLINFFPQTVGPQSEIFRFAQHDMTTLSASTQ